MPWISRKVCELDLVFQFDITNTLEDQVLENVKVAMPELDEESCIMVPAPVIKYGETVVAYTASQETMHTSCSHSGVSHASVKSL